MTGNLVKRRVANLLAIKSLVTVTFTAVYSYLLVKQLPIPENFQNIYLMIVGFYFGSQAEKIQANSSIILPTPKDKAVTLHCNKEENNDC